MCVCVCVAHCQQGCKHGECVGPDRCKCHPGYAGKACNQGNLTHGSSAADFWGSGVELKVSWYNSRSETSPHLDWTGPDVALMCDWFCSSLDFPSCLRERRHTHSCHACLTCEGVFYLKTPKTHTQTHANTPTAVSKHSSAPPKAAPPAYTHKLLIRGFIMTHILTLNSIWLQTHTHMFAVPFLWGHSLTECIPQLKPDVTVSSSGRKGRRFLIIKV